MPWSPLFPAVFHCRTCGRRFTSPLDVVFAVCETCDGLAEHQVADSIIRFGFPEQMEYPSLGTPYDPGQRTMGRKSLPCPTCGAESWGEGNGRRSCINGHLTWRTAAQ